MSTRTLTPLLYGLVIACSTNGRAGELRGAHIGADRKVHIIDAKGRQSKIVVRGIAKDLQMSADKNSAAWRVFVHYPDEPSFSGASEVAIFRHGRLRSLKCTPFIRSYCFHQQGRYIAIDCGGSHFAGTEYLYDIETLRIIDSFDQAEVPVEKRPRWSSDAN